MSIDFIDGSRLRDAVIAAAQRILEVQDRLNRINVFPVADGDTGTNMALTMRSVAVTAMNAGDLPLNDMANKMADAALMGARGNSGAILAQFFQGLSDSFTYTLSTEKEGFVEAMQTAVAYAEEAIAEPAPGTILSVMQAWSKCLGEQEKQNPDIGQLFESSLDVAVDALKKTPDQLEVLKKAGVVDAGAQGFVNMLEGVLHFMKTGSVLWTGIATEVESQDIHLDGSNEDITYRYCTEVLIEGRDLSARDVRSAVAEMGNSLIVAGSKSRLKVHIHTNEPQELFGKMQDFGVIVKTKAEDMREQYAEGQPHKGKIALLMDSSCDLPGEYSIQNHIRVIPVQVTFDGITYADRLDITAEEVYRKMAAGDRASTSQPSPAAFNQALSYASEHYDQAILVTLSGALSGTYQAAQLAARKFKDKIDTRVIDSRSVAGGSGLLVQLAAEYIAQDMSLDEIEKQLLKDRERLDVFVSFPSLDTLKRGGRVNIIQGFFARLLNIVPIIGLKKNGKVKAHAKTRPGLSSWKKILELFKKEVDAGRKLRIVLCHAQAPDALDFLQEGLADLGFKNVDVLEVSPTIVAQVGLGVVGVCIYREAE